MPDSKTLSHTTWDCKYHVVFTPKYRRQTLYKELRQYLAARYFDRSQRRAGVV